MTDLSATGRERLAAIRGAGSLSALAAVLGAADEHEAYFEAKARWRRLRGLELDPYHAATADGVPGVSVRVGERDVHVHGVTHADTQAEREYLREHVGALLDDGHTVYCEQGIRGMYFRDFAGVCAMDDYRWALRECQRRGIESHLEGDPFESLAEDVAALASQFREVAFSLADEGGDRFGRRFERVLGTVASEFLRSHTDHGTGSDFASFRLRERAAADPSVLWRLQRYYECAFLPQPLEREWLRRHDPELEVVTHARNARMADYVVYHADGTSATSPDAPADDAAGEATEDGGRGNAADAGRRDGSDGGRGAVADAGRGGASDAGRRSDDTSRSGRGDVHVVVGAAHQPGVRYYLQRHRAGERSIDSFDAVLE